MIEGQKDYAERAHLYLTDTTRDLCGGSLEDRKKVKKEILEFVKGLLERWDGVCVQEDHHETVITFVYVDA